MHLMATTALTRGLSGTDKISGEMLKNGVEEYMKLAKNLSSINYQLFITMYD